MIFDIFKKFDIRTYLLLAFLLTSLLPILSLSIIEYNYMKEQVISNIKKENNLLLSDISEKLSDYVQKNQEILSLTLSITDNLKSNSLVRAELEKILYTFKDVENIEYYKKTNYIFISKTNTIEKKDKAKFYKEISSKLKNSRNILLETIIENEEVKSFIPIFENNKYSGYIGISFNINKVVSYIKRLLNDKDKIYIYDIKNNKLLFTSKKKREIPIIFRSLINRSTVYEDFDFFIVSQLNWAIVLEHSMSLSEENSLKSNFETTVNTLIIALLFSTLMGLILSYYQYKFIKKFLASINYISNGDYKQKISLDFFLIPLEFFQLIEEFNKMVEQIRLRDNFKSNLIDTVSHEFRTPLTSIKGFSATMLRKDFKFEAESTRKYLRIISNQSDRLSRMVEDLLVVPKLEGNFLKLDIVEINLEFIIKEVSEFFQDIKFELYFDLKKRYVLADSDRLQQILINLIENAKKYSEPKDSPIKIKTFNNNYFAYISIINQAPYISKDKLNTLFDKFVRLDDSLTRKTRGAGLGLYITKALVELMKGTINIKSENNEFYITFSIPLSEEQDF
ncbi:MAG: HAMP domain-containing sensor histidine kinase [Candidatus Sericytochromatia bacterium]